jgi:hypothetical protein
MDSEESRRHGLAEVRSHFADNSYEGQLRSGGVALSLQDVLKGNPNPDRHTRHHLNLAAEHVVDPDRKIVRVKFGKKLTVHDIERYSNLLLANPAFQSTYSEIVDLTEVEEVDLQSDEFLRLADEIDPFSPAAKRAFVVRNSTQNHAARMHKVLRTQRNIEIFRSIEAAERWIAI